MMAERKGISPLIASVLLIVFVISLSSIFLSWIRDYTSGTESDISTRSEEVLDCAGKSVEISDVYLIPSGSVAAIRVNVQNTGDGDIALSDATFTSTLGEKCVFNATAPGTIAKGDSAVLVNDSCSAVSFANSCDSFYKVEVATQCGTDTFKRFERPMCNGTRAVLSE